MEAAIAGAWIETATGTAFNIMGPLPEMINIEDIAHSGSQINRFTGHCKFPYPVSQHSRLGSYLVAPELALRFLLHDASESYIGDMNRPLKHYTEAGKAYQRVEEPLQEAIYAKFGIYGSDPEEIHVIDNQMLYAEKAQLMGKLKWGEIWGRDERAADVKIVETSFADNKRLYLERFNELYKIRQFNQILKGNQNGHR